MPVYPRFAHVLKIVGTLSREDSCVIWLATTETTNIVLAADYIWKTSALFKEDKTV